MQMSRYLLFLPEMLVCGLSYAIFKFLARSPKPICPRRTWDVFTKPGTLRRWLENNYPPKIGIRLVLSYYRNTFAFKNHAYGIAKHYDISNDFYKLFLDKRYMFYTCADFVEDTDTIEKAQDNKANFLLALIDPKPHERILDLGPGWGGMLKKIYEATGNKEHLVGYSLSTEQNKYIEERYRFNVELRNFIAGSEDSFDKIFSIESLEGVRSNELLPLARNLKRMLKPSGRIVHQIICQVNDAPPPVLLIGMNIFPGSELVSLRKHLAVFDKADLKVVHLSIHDYRPTLEAWCERLGEHEEEAVRLVGVRNYNRYLCYFAAAWRLFNERNLLLVRVALEPRR